MKLYKEFLKTLPKDIAVRDSADTNLPSSYDTILGLIGHSCTVRNVLGLAHTLCRNGIACKWNTEYSWNKTVDTVKGKSVDDLRAVMTDILSLKEGVL